MELAEASRRNLAGHNCITYIAAAMKITRGLATRFCCGPHEGRKASFPRPPAGSSTLLLKLRTRRPDYNILSHCPW